MIVSMKKAKIVALKEEKEKLLSELQKSGLVMLIPTEEETILIDVSENDDVIERTEKSLSFLKQYQEKKDSFLARTEVSYDEFFNYDQKKMDLLLELENLEKEIALKEEENKALLEEIKLYEPWLKLEAKVEDLKSSRYTDLFVGYIGSKDEEKFLESLDALGSDYKLYGLDKEKRAIIYASYYLDKEEVDLLNKEFQFSEHKFEDKGFVRDIVKNKEKQIITNNLFIDEASKKLAKLTEDKEKLYVLSDQAATDKELKLAPRQYTLETVYLEGWVRSDKEDDLKKVLETSVSCYDLVLLDPEEGENPPTCNKNNKFVEPFQSVTNMYEVPNYKEVDPNPMMSIWFWFIFGMMMGDVGYGVVMLIGGILFLKLKKPKGMLKQIGKIITYSSIPTILFGVLYGSYFGFGWFEPVFVNPVKEPLTVLIFSFGVGLLHIISGLVVKMYASFKAKDYWQAILDDFPWIVLLLGLGVFAVGLKIEGLSKIGLIMIAASAGIITIFGGRRKQGFIRKITGGFTSLYGLVNHMSDVLSYSRLLALGLSTAIIAEVMNRLAGMVQGSIIGIIMSVFIYIIGHIFNIGMGLLSAYVHDSRLQYIEFFGKFYEGGGYEFRPLSVQLKHVDAIKYKEEKI
ncbi:MAG TPA: V-type ATP synthase subunit I [Bacilli bacterium]|jgi:V/A-type H+-transporting ATPase subunit I|nr:V-type ATP synthase subunit I [Acholeplasmataceae bacterium]HPA98978.1 V-type ATP synthase subunit I [Bacilli bacterium]HQO93736.1 V-type ATP synthase subunit I [Bacilli bacterium]HQQ39465.1 V-type ATP synthase subunit I [Bacilli bacterium]